MLLRCLLPSTWMSTKGALMAPCWLWLRLKCPTMCTSVPLSTIALGSHSQGIHTKASIPLEGGDLQASPGMLAASSGCSVKAKVTWP